MVLLSIYSWVLQGIIDAVWYIFIEGPLYLISAFDEVLKYLSNGIVYQLFFGTDNQFDISKVPYAFYGFCIVAIFLATIFFTVNVFFVQFSGSTKEKIIQSVKMTALAIAITFFIPVGFFILNSILVMFNNALPLVFHSPSFSIADAIYYVGAPNWDGTIVVPPDYGPPSNILDWNIFAELIGVGFMLFAVFLLGLSLVQKIFELFCLFLAAAIIACTMISDNGKRMLIWKDLVIAKLIVGSGTLLSYFVFIFAIAAVLKFLPSLQFHSSFAKTLLFGFLVAGGAMSTLSASGMIASFVGESVGLSEGFESIKNTLVASKGLATGLGFAGAALGFAKSKGAKNGNKHRLFGTLGDGKNNKNSKNKDSGGDDDGSGGDSAGDDSKGPLYRPLQNRAGIPGLVGGLLTGVASGAATGLFAIRSDVEKNRAKGFGKHEARFVTAMKMPFMPITGAAKWTGRKVKAGCKSIKTSFWDAGKIKSRELNQKAIDDSIKKEEEYFLNQDISRKK